MKISLLEQLDHIIEPLSNASTKINHAVTLKLFLYDYKSIEDAL